MQRGGGGWMWSKLRTGLLCWAGGCAVVYLLAISLPSVDQPEVEARGSCGSESHGEQGGQPDTAHIAASGAAQRDERGGWGWGWSIWGAGDGDGITTGHASGCDAVDLRALVARALDEARQHDEDRGAKLLELSLSDCLRAARDASSRSSTSTVADIVDEESAGYEGAEAVTGWSVFWAVWLMILCLLVVVVAAVGSPRALRLHIQSGSRWLPLVALTGAAVLWRVYICPPLERVLVPSLERMIERAHAFNTKINVRADKAEFMRSEDAWLAEINSLNRGFRLEIDQMMDSASAPQPTLMLLFFSLTAAATYGMLVARAVQDVLPASASAWLEPAPFPTAQIGWLIAIPAGWLVSWQGWVGYRVVSSALTLAAVMRGHVTALHRLGEELVAAAANGTNTESPTLPWREASDAVKGIVHRLEGRRWGIKLAGFHMDTQFESTFTSIFVKIVGLALFVAVPLIYAKVQVNERDRKRADELQKHREQVRKIQERYEGLVLADELNAAELTDFKSSHVLDGGQATLFEATYKDETVAVKCMKDQDFSLDTYEHELANRQKLSGDGSDPAEHDTDAVPQEISAGSAGSAEEGEPPTYPYTPQPEPEPEEFAFSRAMSGGGTYKEAIGLAVCHHPNVLSYRGRVDPDKLRTNADFRAAFRKYKGKIPDDDSSSSNGDSVTPAAANSDGDDITALRGVSRRGPQFHRQFRQWYFSSVLITPYCVGRSLHDALYAEGPYGSGGSGGRIGEVRLLVAARSIAKGMKYLHERNLVHNDLKPKNILLDSIHWGLPSRGQRSDTDLDWCCPHVKIGDFGLCEIGGGLGSGSELLSPIGTDPYMSPEMICSPETLDTDDQKKRCDVYSFGMMLLTMVGRKEPWEEQLKRPGVHCVRQWVVDQQTVQKRARGERETVHAENGRPPIPQYVDDGFRALIHRCWHHEPGERPLFEQVFSDLRSLKSLLVLAREDMSGTLWEIRPFSRRKKNEASQPATDEKHRKGVEALHAHGIRTFEALHKALHSAGAERRRLATQQPTPNGVAEDVPPAAASPLASLKRSQLDDIEQWVDRCWNHFH